MSDLEADPPLHVVLFQPEIPYNTGSVGRTCVAIGAKLWLVRPLGFQIDDRQIKRAGMDYWKHLDWQAVDNWDDLIAQIPTTRLWFMTKRGDTDYVDAQFERGDALVFGRESTGLPETLLADAEGHRLRIQTRPEARCLNLSNSVAIVGYEAMRQFRLPK